jgi:carbamoyltransferase
MAEDPIVVGLAVGHDGGCALIKGESTVCAISEERLTRRKHSSGFIHSLLYCLEATDTRLADVDKFVFSCGGPPLPGGFTGGLGAVGVSPARCCNVDHHLSHAVASYSLSPFSSALVVVIDCLGNNADTESYYLAEAGRIQRIGGNDPSRPRCKGIGATYEAFTNFLGFADQESGKTMALSSFGDPDAFEGPLYEVSERRVQSILETTHQFGVAALGRSHSFNLGDASPPSTSERAWNIAAYVQRETERACTELLAGLLRETGARSLCLSGGVALNCVMNSRLRDALDLDALFVPAVCSDTGQPLGNAIYGFGQLTGEIPKFPRRDAFFGRRYQADEIHAAVMRKHGTTPVGRLLRSRFHWEPVAEPSAVAAELLTRGKVIGWFVGGSELGPRALGHRSILGDPRSPMMKDRLNQAVKHREWFRPFAPSALLESAPDWFEIDRESPFMLEAPPVRRERRGSIPAAVHVDGTSRLQTVARDVDPAFHALISEFAELTGVPIVLNTSFNDREPIVETPGDALFTYLTTEMDYLFLENILVSKVD